MLKDKYGKTVKTGDLIFFDEFFVGSSKYQVQRVRYHSRKYGWVSEKVTGDSTPQSINELGHRFIRIPKKYWNYFLEKWEG